MIHDVGDTVIAVHTCTDGDGALDDPTTLQLVVTKPDASTVAYTWAGLTITRDSLGQFHRALVLDQAGVWGLVWTATGLDEVATEHLVAGTPVRKGPCEPWVQPLDVFACGTCADIDEAARDYDLAARCVASASEVLYQLSGRQFPGVCTDTVRPCRRSYSWSLPRWWLDRYPQAADWWGDCTCGAPNPRSCGCSTLDEVTLGASPVLAITRVRVDGATLASSAYRIDDHRYLVRIDGQSWPSCQDLTADPATDTDTWDVTFMYGQPVPQSGRDAAAALACELYQSAKGGACKLPTRVQTITRQGVTVALLDPFDFLEKGKVGVYVVDLFLKAYNPKGRRRRGRIASPDVARRVRRAGS